MSTYRSLYETGKKQLGDAGIDAPETDAWYLLEFVLQIDRTSYYMAPETEVTSGEQERYLALLLQRSQHVPLQYITGMAPFMGYMFHVNEHVLIPRFDTEILVEEALKRLAPKMRILDLCTGSGCIIVSLAAQKIPVTAVGSDISAQALEVAVRNAVALCTQVEFVQGDLFEAVQGCFDLIVSNPPYIPTADMQGLQAEVQQEPALALDGSADGLFFYHKITAKAGDYLNPGGWLLFEIGYDQAEEVAALLQKNAFDAIEVVKDLAGHDRVVLGRKAK
ncbi:MAG: peptide chain release factor N(5)-glutamine methyltransferase [Lachnospiraceae bacterium]